MSFYDIRKRFEIMQLLPFAHVLQILQYLFKRDNRLSLSQT